MFPHPAPAVHSAGLTVILLLALGSTAATPAAHSAATGAVEGFVRDRVGRPVPGARVIVLGTALGTATDSSGHYLVRTAPAGPARLRAEAPGYEPSEAAITVRAGATVQRDLVLSPVAGPLPEMAKASGQAAQRNGAVRADALTAPSATPEEWRQRREAWNTEAYARIEENRFFTAATTPVSTFSIDVDAASYSNVRRFLAQGSLPPADAVRLEEMVNYFPYHYPDRSGEHPFGLIADAGPCPWANDHRLVRIALQARRADTRRAAAEQSGVPDRRLRLDAIAGQAAAGSARLPRPGATQLRASDRVAIVVYAGAAGLVLPSTPGTRKAEILEAIDRLEAGGTRPAAPDIQLAYDVAREHFMPRGKQPRHPGDRWRLQRRRELGRGD